MIGIKRDSIKELRHKKFHNEHNGSDNNQYNHKYKKTYISRYIIKRNISGRNVKICIRNIRNNSSVRYIIISVEILVICAYISRNYYQLILIQGKSMEPTYNEYQLTYVKKKYTEVKRGDVVLFKCEALGNISLIKRVVAVPGDTVCISGGILYINGCNYNELSGTSEKSGNFRYGNIEYAGTATCPIELKKGEYFVIGDNYEYSKDSRYEEIGIVYEKDIIGIVH